MTYSMAYSTYLQSLVDSLRIKNKCHLKESDALRPQYRRLCKMLGVASRWGIIFSTMYLQIQVTKEYVS